MVPSVGEATLSLKNIYRLLTLEDYPLAGPAVIPRSRRRGLTVFGFWHAILAPDLKLGKAGEKLWRQDGTRNRYLSDLFNRTSPVAFYPEYFDAVSGCMTPELLLAVIRRIADFLAGAGYDRQSLSTRLAAFMPLIAEHDHEVIPTVHTFLGELMWQAPDYETDEDRAGFFCAYVLDSVDTR